MAVVIRLKRTGRRNRPCYRISVSDSRNPRDGRTLDTLGLYDPASRKADAQHSLNVERARHWLSVGAIPSDTVRSLFKRYSVYEGEFARALEAPARRKRNDRPGRKKVTRRRARKVAAKMGRAEAKSARRGARLAAKRASATAAASTGEAS